MWTLTSPVTQSTKSFLLINTLVAATMSCRSTRVRATGKKWRASSTSFQTGLKHSKCTPSWVITGRIRTASLGKHLGSEPPQPSSDPKAKRESSKILTRSRKRSRRSLSCRESRRRTESSSTDRSTVEPALRLFQISKIMRK